MTNGVSKTVKTITGIVGLVLIIAGIASTYALNGAKTDKNEQTIDKKKTHNEKTEAELKEEGCMPARESDKDLAVVLEKIIAIEKDVSEIKADVKYLIKSP